MDDDSYTTGSSGSEICKVYDRNDFFTVAVQLLLAGFALLSLWFKRQQEVPRRTLSTWSLDVSKQAAGACYAHVLNMVSSHICEIRKYCSHSCCSGVNKPRENGTLQRKIFPSSNRRSSTQHYLLTPFCFLTLNQDYCRSYFSKHSWRISIGGPMCLVRFILPY